MSTRTWLREVTGLLDELHVHWELVSMGRHIKFRLIGPTGHRGTLVVSVSPSDRQSLNEVRRTVRHMLGLVPKKQAS